MNDPGLDEPIREHAGDIEQTLRARMDKHERDGGLKKLREVSRDGEKQETSLEEGLKAKLKEDEDDVQEAFLQPSRWWFTSTAFPLIAGAFGPLANLASVCALVQTWRVHIPPGGTEIHAERVPDPLWLVGINAVSLVFAVVANVAILMTFAQRIRYQVSLPIIITLWYIASLLLVVLVATVPHRLREHSGRSYAFSQSYYYGLQAAVLYFVISTLLLANYFDSTIRKRYRPSFNLLTIPQRTLMLQTTSLMFYVGIGALVFSRLEEWEYSDTIYWADYTLLTIGLGTDYPLKKTAAKILLMPFAIGGIIILGLVVGSVRSLVLERAKTKMGRRAVEKERRKWVRILESSKKGADRENRSAGVVIKEEFEVMRKIQKNAEAKSKWTSLATSVGVILIVWLGGALVFTFSERKQHWTYFDSLFFSYTSLLTIGYGDYYPQSNSGKPFFVIWSVIAVPAMTILISNMGDTVVVFVREATLWVGKKTILPEVPDRSSSDQSAVTKKAIKEAREALEGSPKEVQKNLASGIKRIVKHVGAVPPKRYTFDEWIEYLELLELEWESDEWSWLNEEGPLLSGLSEPEWLLERLCAKLEQALES